MNAEDTMAALRSELAAAQDTIAALRDQVATLLERVKDLEGQRATDSHNNSKPPGVTGQPASHGACAGQAARNRAGNRGIAARTRGWSTRRITSWCGARGSVRSARRLSPLRRWTGWSVARWSRRQ